MAYYALNIGQTDSKGKFTNLRWLKLIDSIIKYTNSVCIYFAFNFQNIKQVLNLPKNIKIMPEKFPDPGSNLQGANIFWKNEFPNKSFQDAYYNADNGITHIYFMCDDHCIASLEIEDIENYILLDLNLNELNEFINKIPNLTENIIICQNNIEYLSMLFECSDWSPLGLRPQRRDSNLVTDMVLAEKFKGQEHGRSGGHVHK